MQVIDILFFLLGCSHREVGDRLRIAEIRQLVKDDPDFQDLSKAQETELREELLASRDLKRLGARPSNRSAAQDYRRQLKQLNNEVCKTVIVILDINLLDLDHLAL